jgi:glycine/D-amino acid oxidase-like deaminating enzyme
MHQLGNDAGRKELSVVRRLRDVVGFGDVESFQACLDSTTEFEKEVAECSVHPVVVSAEEARDKYNLKGVVGAMLYDCGAFWPYRLITKLWEEMVDQFKQRLSIETRTPVIAVDCDEKADSGFPYLLQTPRGPVRAAKVIHATNGYAGHLLPRLRGKVYPLRGTMSTQQAPAGFGQHGRQRAWSFIHSGDFDAETQVFETGLYYSNQNPNSNDIFIGGERAPIKEMFVADDTVMTEAAKENISNVLPRYFDKGWADGRPPEVRQAWSGILGFTGDRLPFVGSLPVSVTGRGVEGGEWIAAGFNGYGMPQCWSAGEAVATLLLGRDVGEFLPESYVSTEARLHKLSAGTALERLMGH